MWHGIYGHDEVVERFRRALARGRLASSFLFVGPEGIGKRRFAMKFAQALLCQQRPEEAMDPCELCPSCTQVEALTHPDLEIVSKPADKATLPLELLIGDKEHRTREGLCSRIAMKPFMGGRKIAIIDDADVLATEGANSLLKTLEEPPPKSVLILIGTSEAKQLPTIRSRCQPIRFQPLAPEMVAEILASNGLLPAGADAVHLARHSGGSVRRAVELADPAIWEFRDTLYRALREPMLDSVRLATAVTAFVDQAGKEAPLRRARMRQVIGFAAQFYQRLLRRLSGSADSDDDLDGAIAEAAGHWQGDSEAVAACLDRCLEAAEQVDRNVHPTMLVEAWLDGLAAIAMR
jgi:DNA polymerase-3 subunit delta'